MMSYLYIDHRLISAYNWTRTLCDDGGDDADVAAAVIVAASIAVVVATCGR